MIMQTLTSHLIEQTPPSSPRPTTNRIRLDPTTRIHIIITSIPINSEIIHPLTAPMPSTTYFIKKPKLDIHQIIMIVAMVVMVLAYR